MGAYRDGAVRKEEARLTVEYHAPAPGSHSGVADYAETLKHALEQYGRIGTGKNGAGIHLYHLGNNRLHSEIYAQALDTPGVVVLHDAVLQHFMLGTLPHDEYISEWIYNYGEWRRDLGEELWRDRARSAFDPRYFQFPMLRRVLECSRAVIVHNPGAAAIVRANGGKDVAVIPHFCEMTGTPDASITARFRQRINVSQRAALFGIFGYLREPKRVLPCIQAFRRLHAIRPETALLIAGDPVSPDLARVLKIEAEHPGIRCLGHLSDTDLNTAAAAVDCCLNLRFPGVGETSGIAIRLMGFAKSVIVTDNAENSAFPETAVLRVSAGVAESAELFHHILLVAEFPRIARDIGNEARAHIREYHALEPVARRYWEVLCAARL